MGALTLALQEERSGEQGARASLPQGITPCISLVLSDCLYLMCQDSIYLTFAAAMHVLW